MYHDKCNLYWIYFFDGMDKQGDLDIFYVINFYHIINNENN